MFNAVYTVVRDVKRIFAARPSSVFRPISMLWSYIKLLFSSNRDTTSLKHAKILDLDCYYFDSVIFLRLFQDILVSQTYQANITSEVPTIIDCGSNIGMSILYFKVMYPRANIIGFEPNPDQYAILEKNIAANGFDNVVVHQKAVGDEIGTVDFFINEDSPGSLNMGLLSRRAKAPTIQVEVDLLSNYIPESVDLLKLDIEGAEESVLVDLEKRGKIANCKYIICEYHHHIDAGVDRLSNTLGILERAGFGYQLVASPGIPPTLDVYQDMLIYAFNRKTGS
jgi:FkbM family methyltransferase